MSDSQSALTALGNALFTGVETEQWTTAQFVQAALWTKNAGLDSLIVKAAEGTLPWHGGLAGFTAIRNAILQVGVGCLPYIYAYGDTFGGLTQEINLIKEYMHAFGLMCVDMEVQWNSQVGWAQRFNAQLAGDPNLLYLSCLADPAAQNQNAVLQALAPSVDLWMPQVYTDFLQSVWHAQFSAIGIKDGFNLTYSLDTRPGPNDALQSLMANQMLSPQVSLWEYQLAAGARNALFKDCLATVKGWSTMSTATLANFPMVSQLDNDPNAIMDCVAGSLAAALAWLTGAKYSAGAVKDGAYGSAYIGNTAAANYVNYCAQQGVTLSPINGTGQALVDDIRKALTQQLPVLITEPDPYLPGTSETHVCVAYACSPTAITVMDPMIAKPVTKLDSAWVAQLQYNQVWTLQNKPQPYAACSLLQLTDPWGSYFKETATSPARWHCAKTNQDIVGGILAFYRQIGGAPRLPITSARYDIAGVVYQEFEAGILVYDPQGILDVPNAPFEPTYMLKLDSALAQRLLTPLPAK